MKKFICRCLFVLVVVLFNCFQLNAASHTDDFIVPIMHGHINISPDGVVDHSSSLVLSQIYDGLVNLDGNLEIVPRLALRWTISTDRKHYVFDINQSACYLPGECTSGTLIKEYYEWMLKKHPDRKWIFDGLKGLDGYLDGTTSGISGIIATSKKITFELEKPSHLFLIRLASTLARIGFKNKNGDDFFGTGPYKFKSKTSNVILLVSNNLNEYGRRSEIKTIRFVHGYDKQYLRTEFRRGNISLIQIDSEDDVRIFRDEKYQIAEFPSYAMDILVINPHALSLDLRRFIASTVDKERLADVLPSIGITASHSLVPVDLREWNTLRMNTDSASFVKNYVKTTSPIEMLISEKYYDDSKNFFELLRQMMSSDAKKVVFDISDHASYVRKLYANEFDIAYVRYLGDYPDPDAFYYPFLHSKGQFNFMKLESDAVDSLLDVSRQMVDDNDRISIYRKINDKLVADPVVVPLLTRKVVIAMQPTIKNLNINGQGIWSLDISRIQLRHWWPMELFL